MKATDLMVNDWVDSGLDVFQVKWVCDDCVRDKRDNDCELDCLQPIEISSDILKQNGFVLIAVGDNGLATPKKNRNRYEEWECRTTFQTFSLFYDRTCKWYTLDAFDNTIRNIRFVHELQHALRICGAEKEIEL